MPTIAEQLAQLAQIKADIKAAIEAKGETVGSDALSTYATHISNISGGGGDNLPAFITNSLTSLVIPDGVTKIRSNLCNSQTALTSITIPSSVTQINSSAFIGCTGLTSITIPEGVVTIADNVFKNCTNLLSISLPSTLRTLQNYAFNACAKLPSIVIPEGVTTLPIGLFYTCNKLEYVDLPSTVTTMKNQVLDQCKAVKTIICRATTPPTVTSSVFGSSNNGYTGRNTYNQGVNKLYVPQGCSSAYNTSYWASVLLDSTKCGFTIAELDANGNIPT